MHPTGSRQIQAISCLLMREHSKLHTVNPGPLRAPIGVRYSKKSP
jgi:hypothetical protein